ncbi:hypothetical protein GGR58DRAFT_219483 [Xylaria digitata]|nr:hypothetical protein GGR58DRAFT_219483 [Xylaria digitata]
MLEVAGILYDVNLQDDDGICFDGISYTLYPTAYIQDHHLALTRTNPVIQPKTALWALLRLRKIAEHLTALGTSDMAWNFV